MKRIFILALLNSILLKGMDGNIAQPQYLATPIILTSIDLNNVAKQKEIIRYEIQKEKYIKYTLLTALVSGTLGYWAYNHIHKSKDFSYSYEDKIVLHNLINLYKSGYLVSKPSWFKSVLGTFSSFSSAVTQAVLAGYASNKMTTLFKETNLNSIIEKSRLKTLTKSLKHNFAKLSPQSKIFNLTTFPLEANLNKRTEELFELRALAISAEKYSDQEINNIIDESVVLTNDLTKACEMVIAYFESQSEELLSADLNNEARLIEQTKTELLNQIVKLQNTIQVKLNSIRIDKKNDDLLIDIYTFGTTAKQLIDNIELMFR